MDSWAREQVLSLEKQILELSQQLDRVVKVGITQQEQMNQLLQRLTTLEDQGKKQTPNDAERYWTTDGKGPAGP